MKSNIIKSKAIKKPTKTIKKIVLGSGKDLAFLSETLFEEDLQ